jgi:hypothetical protein
MRVFVLVRVAALAGSPAMEAMTCRCEREATKPACCCGDASTGTCCCCTGKGTGESRTLRTCMCKEAAPRAVENPAVDTPAMVAAPVVPVRAPRPVAVERAGAPREAPAPVPGFRPPLLI